jgi:hypothetical protein
LVNDSGLTYPVWDFNGVDISAANQGKSTDFWMDVNGVTTSAARWTYSTSDETAWPPLWQQKPTTSCAP